MATQSSLLDSLLNGGQAAQAPDDRAIDIAADVLTKQAAAQNIDLNQFSEEQLQQAMLQIIQDPEFEKVASAYPDGDAGKTMTPEQQAIYENGVLYGQGMRDGFEGAGGEDDLEKIASGMSDDELVSALALDRAEAFLAAINSGGQDIDGLEKTAALELPDDVEFAVCEATIDILEHNGFDAEEVLNLLGA